MEKSRARDAGGAGLGPAITHRIVLAHGGQLAIGAAALGGAAVRISLPRSGGGPLPAPG